MKAGRRREVLSEGIVRQMSFSMAPVRSSHRKRVRIEAISRVHRRRADLAFLRAVDDPFAHLVCGDAARVGARLVEIQPCQELPDVVFVIADGERGVTPFGAEVSDEFR